jgi:PAS domain S-box-containing protein
VQLQTTIRKKITDLLSSNSDGYDVLDFRVGTLIGTCTVFLVTIANYFSPNAIPDIPVLRNALMVIQLLAVVGSFFITPLKRWANETGNLFSLLYACLVVCIAYDHDFQIVYSAYAILCTFFLCGMFKNLQMLKIYMTFIYSFFFVLVLVSDTSYHDKITTVTLILPFAFAGYYIFSLKLNAVASVEKREKEVAQREAWFRSIFENVPVGIALLDEKHRAFKFNHYFEQMTGFDEKNLIDLGMEQLTHPDDTLFGDDFMAFVTSPEPHAIEQRIQTKENKTIWVRVSLSKMDMDDKVYTIAMFNDITLEKTANMQLRESAKQLKSHNEALEEFSYVISHDLQEPLRMITAFTQIIQKRYIDKIDNPEAKKDFAFVIDGAKRMSNLIIAMLEYSRWSAKELPVEKVDTRKVLAVTLQNLTISLSNSNAEVVTDNLPIINANGLMLGQIFQNLISNAIRYAHPSRNPLIEIKIEKKSDYVLFAFKDNGIGFEDRYKERIFGIFQRLDPDKSGGTGMGLAICKRTIERQGGSIWAESELNVGSTFYFTLPYIETIDTEEGGVLVAEVING